ncbi:YesK-like family protein [Bacillus sp. DX4.1]|uniref:YesK-like family protein n=1 Tax=Bacillus sp. DX4.1 TaxID=3055867 RepID=UPI0025A13ED1|nr:YesK-like family protein [Bacillus sp. DX4.1]MDM5186917.1 YesK-like family protein [Bacillus sp. DX4.1]
MNGFETFFIIGAVTILIVFTVSFLLKKQFPHRRFDITFALILMLLCFVFFPVTVFAIGGWDGMGYAIACFFVLLGTIIGMIAHQFVKLFRNKYV